MVVAREAGDEVCHLCGWVATPSWQPRVSVQAILPRWATPVVRRYACPVGWVGGCGAAVVRSSKCSDGRHASAGRSPLTRCVWEQDEFSAQDALCCPRQSGERHGWCHQAGASGSTRRKMESHGGPRRSVWPTDSPFNPFSVVIRGPRLSSVLESLLPDLADNSTAWTAARSPDCPVCLPAGTFQAEWNSEEGGGLSAAIPIKRACGSGQPETALRVVDRIME